MSCSSGDGWPGYYSIIMTDEKTITSISSDPSEPGFSNACVVQIYGGNLGKLYSISNEITVGRGELNTVVVDLPNVSRNHARFFIKGGICYVIDLGSTNGTYVNDVEAISAHALANGDLVAIGGSVFKFIAGGNIEALYHEEIYRLTILDGLTGVHNKRYFLEFIERELARAIRYKRPLSLAMIDLDHFKNLNDTFGHLAGDHTLRKIAQLMDGKIRREELLARYGGEEFAIVLPETDGAGAKVFCQRMCVAVAEHQFEFDGKEIELTVSIGIATVDPSPTDHEMTPNEFIRIADEALYRAKQEGRNRVVIDGD